MRTTKSCVNCVNGISMIVNGDILCYKNGVVAGDYLCKAYQCDLNYEDNIRDSLLKCIRCINFISEADNPNLGYCRLFTVRKFDGTKKDCCSRAVLCKV